MRCLRTGLSTVLVLLVLSTVASSHWETYFMPQVPEPGEMSIDGKDDDWAWYDDAAFAISPAEMFDALGGAWPPAKDDWDVVLRVAWSPLPDNCLYYFARVSDDSLGIKYAPAFGSYLDDSLEIIVDADDSGGYYRRTRMTSQQYGVKILPAAGQPDAWLYVTSGRNDQWSAKEPFFIYRWTLDPPDAAPYRQPEGSVVRYTYEVKQQIWDRYDDTSAASSLRHVFGPGQTIGLTFQFDEADNSTREREVQVSTTPNFNAYVDNSYGSDFITVAAREAADPATAGGVTTWGRVKASFQDRH